MALEIERKFLLSSSDWRSEVTHSHVFRQGYLNNEVRCSIRIRTAANKAWLNIKSVTIGSQRQEFEYEIPCDDATVILDSLALRPFIEKIRHFVSFGQHTWEIDEFLGENQGLIVAEIELNDPSEEFARPSWLGKEVTEDVRYYNTNLCRHPFLLWSEEEIGEHME